MVDGVDEGQLTYCYSYKQGFEEGIILGQKSKHFWIGGDIDENCEGILGYGLFTLSQCLLVFPS